MIFGETKRKRERGSERERERENQREEWERHAFFVYSHPSATHYIYVSVLF